MNCVFFLLENHVSFFFFKSDTTVLLLLAARAGRNCSKPVKVKCCLFQFERTIFENVSGLKHAVLQFLSTVPCSNEA